MATNSVLSGSYVIKVDIIYFLCFDFFLICHSVFRYHTLDEDIILIC